MTLWIIIVGFAIGFALAFSIGANDVANSFGTSVGSKVLTLRRACILASIFELAGAVLVGSKVSSTISKGIIKPDLYADDVPSLEIGYLSSLIGACIWLLVATFFKLPVSGTHGIVGAVLGFTLVAKGVEGVQWTVLLQIVSSWFISPLFSGLMSAGIYFLMQFTIFRLPTHIRQLERGIFLLPFIYAATFSVNSFSVFYDGPQMFYFHLIPWWGSILASIGVGVISAILARFVIGPRLQRHIMHRRPTLANLAGSKKSTPAGSRLSLNNPNPPGPGTTNVTMNTSETTQLQINGEALNNFNLNLNNSFTDGTRTPRGNFFFQQENGEDKAAVAQKLLLDEAALAPSLSHSVSSLFLVTPFATTPQTAEQILQRQQSQVTLPPEKGENHIPANIRIEHDEIEYPGIFQLFAFLQILTACFGAFAHGGNDVSNAIGPVIGLYGLHQGRGVKSEAAPEIWILALGGVGITFGLWLLGRRVIETVGTDLSEISPPSGFCIELGAATTVLIASQVGVPVSTTHCKIGSVVIVGISRGGLRQIDWRIFRNIILAWAVTVPASGLVSAGVMYLLNNVLYFYILPPRDSVFGFNSTNGTNGTANFFDLTNSTTTITPTNLTNSSGLFF